MASSSSGKTRAALSKSTASVILTLSTAGGVFIGWGNLPVELLWLPALCGAAGGVFVCLYLTWTGRWKAEKQEQPRRRAVLLLYALLLVGGIRVVIVDAKPEDRYSAILGISMVMLGVNGLVDTWNRQSSQVGETEHEQNKH